MSRLSFVPVPHVALELCSGKAQRAAVSELYYAAHLRRWRPIGASQRELEDTLSLPRVQVQRLLGALEAAGLVVYDRRAKIGGLLTVLDPTKIRFADVAEDEDHDGAEDLAGHPSGPPVRATLAGQRFPGSTPTVSEGWATSAGHPSGPPVRATSRAHEEINARAETETYTESETEIDLKHTQCIFPETSAPPTAPPLSVFTPSPAFFAVFPKADAWKSVDGHTLKSAQSRGHSPFLSPAVERMIAAGLMQPRSGAYVLTAEGEALADALAAGSPVWPQEAPEPTTETPEAVDASEAPTPAPVAEAVIEAKPVAAVTPAAVAAPAPVLALQPDEDEPEIGDHQGAPRWASSERRPKGVSAMDLAGMVCRIADDITGSVGQMHRRGTAAKPILALWRALGRPPCVDFEREVRLVAEAARLCPAPLFARDVRAEGWDGGTDRQRDVTTLCVQARWDERLRVAQEWAAAGRSQAKPVPKVTPAPARHGRQTIAEMLADLKTREAPEQAGRLNPRADVIDVVLIPQEPKC